MEIQAMKKASFLLLVLMVIPVAGYPDAMTFNFSAYDSNMHFIYSGGDVQTQLGVFTLHIRDIAPATDWPNDGNFLAFCVDIQHYAGNSNNVVLNDMAQWRQPYSPVPQKFPKYAGAGSYAAYMINYFGMPGTLMEQSAMQLAVWEILYEYNGSSPDKPVFNVTQGVSYATGIDAAVISQANEYLSLANNLQRIPDAHAPWIQTLDDNGSYYQDFTTTVPEPSTLILLGSGLLAGCFALRKKFRSN